MTRYCEDCNWYNKYTGDCLHASSLYVPNIPVFKEQTAIKLPAYLARTNLKDRLCGEDGIFYEAKS